MTIAVWDTNLFRLYPGSNAINLPWQINYFEKKGKNNVYFVLRRGNPMKREKRDIKNLMP